METNTTEKPLAYWHGNGIHIDVCSCGVVVGERQDSGRVNHYNKEDSKEEWCSCEYVITCLAPPSIVEVELPSTLLYLNTNNVSTQHSNAKCSEEFKSSAAEAAGGI